MLQREMESEVAYRQNGQDCSVAVHYWITADLCKESFSPITALDKRTGKQKDMLVYVAARDLNERAETRSDDKLQKRLDNIGKIWAKHIAKK